jgi:hypothetical protein
MREEERVGGIGKEGRRRGGTAGGKAKVRKGRRDRRGQ